MQLTVSAPHSPALPAGIPSSAATAQRSGGCGLRAAGPGGQRGRCGFQGTRPHSLPPPAGTPVPQHSPGRGTAPLTAAARRSAGPRPCAPARSLSAACCSCPPPSPPPAGTAPRAEGSGLWPPLSLPPPHPPRPQLPPLQPRSPSRGRGRRQPSPAALTWRTRSAVSVRFPPPRAPHPLQNPPRFPCYCVTGGERNTWLRPPRHGSPRQQRPPPAVTRQGGAGSPRYGSGSGGAALCPVARLWAARSRPGPRCPRRCLPPLGSLRINLRPALTHRPRTPAPLCPSGDGGR